MPSRAWWDYVRREVDARSKPHEAVGAPVHVVVTLFLPNSAVPYWLHLRDFESPQQLADLYRQAAENVEQLPTDPTHRRLPARKFEDE